MQNKDTQQKKTGRLKPKNEYFVAVIFTLNIDSDNSVTGWPCLFRLVRIARFSSYSEFVVKCEQHLKSPHLFRIVKTLMYLIFVIHITACLYFAMSTDFGIGKNAWVYQESDEHAP